MALQSAERAVININGTCVLRSRDIEDGQARNDMSHSRWCKPSQAQAFALAHIKKYPIPRHAKHNQLSYQRFLARMLHSEVIAQVYSHIYPSPTRMYVAAAQSPPPPLSNQSPFALEIVCMACHLTV